MNSYVLRPSYAKKLGLISNNIVGTLGHRRYITNNDIDFEKVAYPLAFSVSKLEYDQMSDLIEILEPIVRERIGFQWTGTKLLNLQDCTLIYPICEKEFVYMTEAERVRLTFSKLDDLIAYKLVWSDLRAYPYLKTVDHYPGARKLENVIVCHKIWLEYVCRLEQRRRNEELEYQMMNNKMITTNDEAEIREWLTAELAMVWNFERVTEHGVTYYSQSPQNILYKEKERKAIERKIRTISAYAKTESIDTYEYKSPLHEIDLKHWLTSSVDRIIVGLTPLVKVKATNRNLLTLHRKAVGRNPWLSKFPPWRQGDIDYFPVLDPDDLLVYTGGEPYVERITDNLPIKEYVTKLPDSTFRAFGDYISVWAAYLLASKNFTSCII